MRTACATVAVAVGLVAIAHAQSRPDLTGLWIHRPQNLSRAVARRRSLADAVWSRAISQGRSGQLTGLQVPAVRANTRTALDQSVSDHPDAGSDRDHHGAHRLPDDLYL